MPSCVAIACTNRSESKKLPSVSFHKFPRDPQLRAAWIVACRRKDWMPSSSSVLCSEHFLPELVQRTRNGHRAKLQEDAVPSVFKMYTISLKKPLKRRNPPKDKRPLVITFPSKSKESDEFSSVPSSNNKVTDSTAVSEINEPVHNQCSPMPVSNTEIVGSDAVSEIHDPVNNQCSPGIVSNHMVDSTSVCEINEPVCNQYTEFSENSWKQGEPYTVTKSDVALSPVRELNQETVIESLRQKLEKSNKLNDRYCKKIRILQQQIRRSKRKIETLRSGLDSLESKKKSEKISSLKTSLNTLKDSTLPSINILKPQVPEGKQQPSVGMYFVLSGVPLLQQE